MVNSYKKVVNPWGIQEYCAPKPYLRPRVENDSSDPLHPPRFSNGVAEGPKMKVGKAKKPNLFNITTYGNDGKNTLTYIDLVDWKKETSPKRMRKNHSPEYTAKAVRGTYIDMLFHNEKKYRFPSPNAYNTTVSDFQKKSPKKKDEDSNKKLEKKIFTRTNYFSDVEYLGMNNPSPGDYKIKVFSYFL